MKKQIKFLVLIAIAVSLLFAMCKKDKDELSAEDAKIEIRASSQKVQANMSEMMAAPAMGSMVYLSELMNVDGDWKSSASHIEKYNLAVFNKIIRDNLKIDEIDPEEGGEYTYNFLTEDFDLTDESITYLLFIFPADDVAHAAHDNNGALKLDNIEFVEVEYDDGWDTYTEQVLTRVNATLKIDGITVMTFSYSATLNNEGLPVATSVTYNMAPYQMTLTQIGSGVNYTSTASLKKGSDILLSYNLTIKYTAQQDEVERASGSFQVTPLKFDGEIKALAMENCSENDIDCMNKNIDVAVIQTEKNKIIGNLEFRLFYDSDWDETYPEPAIVYSDGTWEWLFEAMAIDLDGLKRGLLKK